MINQQLPSYAEATAACPSYDEATQPKRDACGKSVNVCAPNDQASTTRRPPNEFSQGYQEAEQLIDHFLATKSCNVEIRTESRLGSDPRTIKICGKSKGICTHVLDAGCLVKTPKALKAITRYKNIFWEVDKGPKKID